MSQGASLNMMTRIFGHYVSREMVLLWLLEAGLCFAVFYTLLASNASFVANAPFVANIGPAALSGGFNFQAANHAAIFALIVGISSIALGLYRPEICLQTRVLLLNTAAAGLLAFPIILAFAYLLGLDLAGLFGHATLWPAEILLAWIASLLATRAAFSFAMRLDLFARPMLIVGAEPEGARTSEAIAAMRRGLFKAVSVVNLPATAAQESPQLGVTRLGVTQLGETPFGEHAPAGAKLPRMVDGQRIWGVVYTPAARARIATAELVALRSRGIRLFDDVEFRERQTRRLDLDALDPSWLLTARGLACGPAEAALRRAGDIAIAIGFLVATLPLMLLTALLIKLDSPGPVFYRQERAGLHGKPFTLFKFRSMYIDAEARGPTWAVAKDPRVTRLGAFLRLTRIDELPQLVNVLRGEMGFIGPRPERPHFIGQLAEAIPHYADRAYVKPGLTGWAQVSFRYGASIEDARVKLSYDLYYVKHRTLFLDLLILFATVRVILFQEGAR